MSISWLTDVEPAPAILVLPPAAASLDEAHAAIELWEFYKRRRLDATQRLAVEVMMATAADGLWAATTTGRPMSRQNGKGDEIEVVELWGLVQRAERILHTVHDAVLLATETQSRLLSVIEGHADLRRLKARAWKGTGQQMIEMRNGGIIWYRTRTGGGARGVDEVDRIVVDEAQHAEEEHLAAITPTQLAAANPQLNALGSAAIDGKSVWWWRLRRRALSPNPGAFGFVEHTAEEVLLDGDRIVRTEIDWTDPVARRQATRRANPALVAGRVEEAFFEEQYQRLGPLLYGREHGGVWDAEPGVGGHLAMPDWPLCAATIEKPSTIESHRQWALAVSPIESGQQWGAIGIAGRRADGELHGETMEHRSLKGWDLVGDIVKGWEAKRIPIRVRKNAPEGAFIAPLRERGVEVIEVSNMEFAQACGLVIDAVANRLFHHIGQASLDKAAAGAEMRTSADGASVWSQRNSHVEITPLVAVTIALGGVPAPSTTTGLFLAVT